MLQHVSAACYVMRHAMLARHAVQCCCVMLLIQSSTLQGGVETQYRILIIDRRLSASMRIVLAMVALLVPRTHAPPPVVSPRCPPPPRPRDLAGSAQAKELCGVDNDAPLLFWCRDNSTQARFPPSPWCGGGSSAVLWVSRFRASGSFDLGADLAQLSQGPLGTHRQAA